MVLDWLGMLGLVDIEVMFLTRGALYFSGAQCLSPANVLIAK